MSEPTPREALIFALIRGLPGISEVAEKNARIVVDALDAYILAMLNGRDDDIIAMVRESARHEAAAVAALEEKNGRRHANTCPTWIGDYPCNCRTPARDSARHEEAEPLYPCDYPGCTVMRTKAEGGTTFTVCDKHWDEHYGRAPAKPEPTPEREEHSYELTNLPGEEWRCKKCGKWGPRNETLRKAERDCAPEPTVLPSVAIGGNATGDELVQQALKAIDTFYYGAEVGDVPDSQRCSQCDATLPEHKDNGYETCPVLLLRRALRSRSTGAAK